MFSIVNRQRDELPDVRRFVDLLNDQTGSVASFFTRDSDILVARAPGRLDVMGGIADYSGSLVLQLPIAEATLAAVQLREGSDVVRIVSLDSETDETRAYEFSTNALRDAPGALAKSCHGQWYGYTAGVFIILSRELGFDFRTGASIVISSDVPIGKGVSSSAALEVSVMTAVCGAYGIKLDSRSIAVLCQKVENMIVGAACGIMDQMSVNFGVENSLLNLVCQPAEIDEPIPIPSNINFAGIDSGVRHAVVGSDYASVRTAAFMGYRIISEVAGLPVSIGSEGRVEISDPQWRGYLANVSVDDYESRFRTKIPEVITGREFLGKYGGITDAVTSVVPQRTYAVRAATEHPIYENDRIDRFRRLLQEGKIGETEFQQLGELMYASHESYSRCGLTEDGTDRLVELARTYRDRGVSGARITGGGSGGTVVFLVDRDSIASLKSLAAEYKNSTERQTYFFVGSSPGCASHGIVRLSYV